MTTYHIKPVASLTDAIEQEAHKQAETVLKFKSKEKKGYFFTAPALTDNDVLMFVNSSKGMEAAKDYLDSLRKGVAKKLFDNGQMFRESDCNHHMLAEFASASSDNIRCSKDNIIAAFDAGWNTQIAYALVLERDATSSVVLLGDDVAAKAAFWNSEAGLKFMAIASNYKSHLCSAAERKPSFMNQAIKDKVLQAIAYLDQEDVLVQKVEEKLRDAPIATVDADSL